MPWDTIKLNDGSTIPSLAFGTWKLGSGQVAIDYVDQAISVGFVHIDTAQSYRNETEAGAAIRESRFTRENIYITTKYSGSNGLDIPTSIKNSLKNLGIAYVDLYLIHDPMLIIKNMAAAWKQMEDIKEQGLAKSIGVSNFEVSHLELLMANAKIKPVANQIELHPYVYAQQRPIIEYGAEHGIVVEAYSPLIPVTTNPCGPLDEPLSEIAKRLDATADQVLLAWVKAKGAIAVTMSKKKERLDGYITAGDLKLTPEDVAALDNAGAKGGEINSRT